MKVYRYFLTYKFDILVVWNKEFSVFKIINTNVSTLILILVLYVIKINS